MQTSRNWNSIAAVGAAIQLSPTGIRSTGRSLSGMSSSTGASARMNSSIGMRWIDSTSVGISMQFAVRAGPHHHRRDRITGTRDEIVEAPHYGVGVETQPDLLGHLAQRGLFGCLTFVDAAAGQCPLPGVIAQLRRATRQYQRGARLPTGVHWQPRKIRAITLVTHRDGDRGRAMSVITAFLDDESREVVADPLLEPFVTLHDDLSSLQRASMPKTP